jgi:rhombotail lipoprotein
MRNRTAATLMMLLCWLPGCAGSRGFDRPAMQTFLKADASEALELETAGRPSLRTPLRLAFFFIEDELPSHRTIRKADWVTADKERLKQSLAPLVEEGLLSEIVFLTDATIRGHQAVKIRQAALRYGADAVLVVNGLSAVDRFNNALAWLYPTLLGAYIVDGTESRALFMLEGSLRDVGAGQVLAREQAEGTAALIGPAMGVEDREVLRQAKAQALDELGARIAAVLRRLSQAAPKAGSPSRGVERQ